MTNTLPRATHGVEHTHYDEQGVERHMRAWLSEDGIHHITLTTNVPGRPEPIVNELHMTSLAFGLLAGLLQYAVANLGRPGTEVTDVPA